MRMQATVALEILEFLSKDFNGSYALPCRVALLVLVMGCMQASFVLEQPGSSVMFMYAYLRAAFAMLKRAGMQAG